MDPYTRKSLYSIKMQGREKWIGELENYIVNKLATTCDAFILGSVQIPSVSFSTSHNNKQQHRISPQHNNSLTFSSISLSYVTERSELDGELRGEPRDRIKSQTPCTKI